MAIINQLPEYVKAHADELLTKAMLEGTTLKYVSIIPSVKYKDSLAYLSSTVEFQSAETCGFNASGDDTLSERTIEVAPIKVNKEFCEKTLRKSALNHGLLYEAGREKLPFEEKFMDSNVTAINVELEKEIWQNTDSDLFPGFIEQIVNGDASVGSVNYQIPAGYDAADVIDAAYDRLPETVLKKGAVIFVSHTTFKNYVKALNATCCANRPMLDAAADEIEYPGDSRVKIVPVAGLQGAQDRNGADALAVATWAKNLVYGTDVEGSENTFKFWYSDDDDVFKFKVLFNAGTATIFPDEIVYIHS